MQTEDHTSPTCRQWEAIESSALRELAASHPFPARLEAHCRREASNKVGAYNGTMAMTTLQDLYTIKPDQSLAWMEVGTDEVPSLAEVTDGCWRGMQVMRGCLYSTRWVLDPGTYREHQVDSESLETEYMKLGENMWWDE